MPMRPRRNTCAAHMLCALLLALAFGCRREASAPERADDSRTEDMSRGELHLELRLEPGRVRYDTDTLLTIAVDVPSQVDIELPPLHDRVQGFDLQGTYATDAVESGGRRRWTVHARLTPTVSETHRIAPMAVRYTDRGHSPPETGWLTTRPVELESAPPVEQAPDRVEADLAPDWIAPSVWSVSAWIGALLLLAALVYGAVRLAQRFHREAVLRRLSPRERALRELDELLRRQLVQKHLVKDFYLELTMIVRRYIERAHGVRAPEQTTEEFLSAVREDTRFSPAIVGRLGTFLQAADLVKFAAYQPDTGAVNAATQTAREYVDADAREQDNRALDSEGRDA